MQSSPGVALFDAFYRSGALVFGGGHVVLPLLREAFVAPGWVSDDAFLAGYGAAQAVPGPLFTFAAYLGAVVKPSPHGIAGAALGLFGIFLPGILILLGALPFWDSFRTRAEAQAVMRGVNAAVVGLLGAALYNPLWTSSVKTPGDFGVALVGFVLLSVWRAPPLLVVVVSALAGIALALQVVMPMTRRIFQRYFAGLSRTTFLLAFASMFADISTEMLYPVLPVFLTQTLHAGGSIVGLIDGFAQAVQNIVQGFSGTLSDKLQKRKSIALAGFLLSAISKPLMGLAPAWQVLFGARMLDRLGAGSRSAPRDALIASSVAEENRGRAFGLEGLGDNAGAFLGRWSPCSSFMRCMSASGRSFIWRSSPDCWPSAWCCWSRSRTPPPRRRKWTSACAIFPRDYWKFLLVTALFGLGNSSNAFLILRTQDIDASLPTTIAIYAGYNLIAALISYPAGWLFDKWGGKNALLLCYVIFLIAYVGFAVTQNVVLIAGLFVFYGLYQGIFRTAGKSVASSLVPDRLRASGIGWYNTTLGLLQLVASVIAGLLWDRIGHVAVFYYGAVFAAVGIAALLLLIPGRAEPRAPAA